MSTPILTEADITTITADAPYGISEQSVKHLAALIEGQRIPQLLDADGDILDLDILLRDPKVPHATDQCGEDIFQVAPGVVAHLGNYERAFYRADSIREFLGNWDFSNYGTAEELMVSFGFAPELEEADEAYEGECKVWITPHYYTNTFNAPLASWLTDDSDYSREPLVFEDRQKAQEAIDEIEDSARGCRTETDPRGCYVLSHGEYASPTYTICKA